MSFFRIDLIFSILQKNWTDSTKFPYNPLHTASTSINILHYYGAFIIINEPV